MICTVNQPQKYLDFLAIFEALNVNVVDVFKLGCVPDWNFHSSVVFICMLPVALGAIFAVAALYISHFIAKRKLRARRYGQLVYWFLMLLYLLYPSMTYFM